MSWMKYSGGRLPDFEDVVRRFSVAVLIMGIATIWLIFEIHRDDFSDDQGYIFGGFIFAGYSAVIGRLIGEARAWSGAKSAVLSIALALSAFLLGAFGERLKFIFPLAIGGAILFLGNAAAWRIARNDASVWNFTQKLWTGAIFAAVGSVIFAVGMFIISEAVRALFGLNLEDITIKTLLPVGLLFLAPVYWMGTLPRYGEAEDVAELSFEARALSFLGTWMLAPLVSIYALIILAYGTKVLLQWELPKGEIAFLVSPFLGVGMLVWLMLEPKVLKQGGFVRFYRAAWHWVMLPAAILLGVSVIVRIREYGFTPIRLFLAMIVIWAVVQSLWFTMMPQLKRDIRIPTGVAAALLLLGAFAAEPLSASSQFNRALAAKPKLIAFSKGDAVDHPEAVKVFIGAVDFLIRHKEEKYFKRLLPNQKMPENTYGANYTKLIRDFGLETSDSGEKNKRRIVEYSVASKMPISIENGAKLYVTPSAAIHNKVRNNKPRGIISWQRGRKLTLTAQGEIFDVNLDGVFSNLEWVGLDDWNVDTLVPPISIVSDKGAVAKLVILDGRVNLLGEEVNGGEIILAVILSD